MLAIWITIYLVVVPPFAHAASAGGWAFNSFNAATSVVTAFKNGVSASVAVAKSPIVSKIAKGVAGGVIAGAALPLAISQISGLALNAVDWVLDPANNSITYKSKTAAYSVKGFVADTAIDACKKYALSLYPSYSSLTVDSRGVCSFTPPNSTRVVESSVTELNPRSGSIPIPTVAQKIYDMAKS